MDGAALHRAFESLWWQIFGEIDGAVRDRRSDLTLFVYPPIPIAQFNAAWVAEDSAAAAEALPQAIADIGAAGARAWVQARARHARVREAATALGLTHVEDVPAMLVARDDLRLPQSDLEVEQVTGSDFEEVTALAADAFDLPVDVLANLNRALLPLEGFSWYLGRAGGEIVATSIGATVDGAVGIFNVATAERHRGRGYGAAVTARAACDGFDAGAVFAFLQTSALGHGVYRRLGFRDVEDYVLLTRPAAPDGRAHSLG